MSGNVFSEELFAHKHSECFKHNDSTYQ